MKTQNPNDKKITIRVPDEVHAALVQAAKDDDRSLNAEILALLKLALASR
jgi:predicted HicB family RNase H-like nuclease